MRPFPCPSALCVLDRHGESMRLAVSTKTVDLVIDVVATAGRTTEGSVRCRGDVIHVVRFLYEVKKVDSDSSLSILRH
jgi:hypothetical protein